IIANGKDKYRVNHYKPKPNTITNTPNLNPTPPAHVITYGPTREGRVYDVKTFPLELAPGACQMEQHQQQQQQQLAHIQAVRVKTWCWWCCHPFDSFPVYLPVKYHPKTKQFKVKGCFCSFNCVMAYGLTERRTFDEAKSLTRMLYRAMTGNTDGMHIQ